MNNKTQIKTDEKCQNYNHEHCMLTQSVSHSTFVMPCNTAAAYCDRKKGRQ